MNAVAAALLHFQSRGLKRGHTRLQTSGVCGSQGLRLWFERLRTGWSWSITTLSYGVPVEMQGLGAVLNERGWQPIDPSLSRAT